MSEIKLVSIKTAQERFKDYMKEKGISLSSSLVHINKISQFEEQERKELRAAYEAKCNEVAQLQKENVELKHINLTSLANLHFKNRELEARNSELEAVRLAYANEFPLNSEGEPDVGSIHHNIRELKKSNSHLQFLLDSIMLEYCPNEMTEEQMENWKKAQRAVDTADPEYYKSDTYKNNVKFSVDMIK